MAAIQIYIIFLLHAMHGKTCMVLGFLRPQDDQLSRGLFVTSGHDRILQASYFFFERACGGSRQAEVCDERRGAATLYRPRQLCHPTS